MFVVVVVIVIIKLMYCNYCPSLLAIQCNFLLYSLPVEDNGLFCNIHKIINQISKQFSIYSCLFMYYSEKCQAFLLKHKRAPSSIMYAAIYLFIY